VLALAGVMPDERLTHPRSQEAEMKNIARRWRTLLLAVPVMGALGFGATQALASPGAARQGRECLPDKYCWAACPYAGGNLTWRGDCMCCEY
jgi:hypothetical protein